MKKILFLMVGFLLSSSIWADVRLEPLLNKITLQLQAEQWVTTKTALVDVSVNASVTDQGIEKIQAEVMQKLNQLSNKSEWHVATFDRQQDSSGLESIQITAQARLPQTELSHLRNQAKSISIPGEKFTVDNIQFTPNNDELRLANITLRNNLYQQAKAEVDTLNKIYPEQKYYLHQIDFMVMSPPVMPMPMVQSNVAMGKSTLSRAVTPLSVGNKIQLQAAVIIASLPDFFVQKLTH
jgi:hypothetical protein